MERQNYFICIDLKSFYASVECVERKLDPFKTNLVVADPTRSKSTICLAITPAMKKLGVKNRCRIHEIPDNIQYITAMPRMQLYLDYSARIYSIYLRYVSKEDIHVYSVDECFIDVTEYLHLYHMTPKEMAVELMRAVMDETGITATAGVGTNLYLAKIAMDIVAKHVDDHIGILNEISYREKLWDHQPLRDFWMIGSRTEKKLSGYGIHTMGDIALASITSEDLLFKIFGIDAELLIDHAWGRESVIMADIKAYRPESSSISGGQVLARDYTHEECRLVVKEMTDALCLELAERGLVTESVTLSIGFSNKLKLTHAHGTASLPEAANTYRAMIPYIFEVYDRIADPALPIRRLSLSANNVTQEAYVQYSLFSDREETERDRKAQRAAAHIGWRFMFPPCSAAA